MIAEDQPIDIWNIDKKAIETTSEDISSNEITGATAESNIYNMQTDKKKSSIKKYAGIPNTINPAEIFRISKAWCVF